MRFIIAILIIISVTNAFQIKPITSKKITKVSHTKIHDISYRSPIRIRRMEPFAFRLVKEMSNTINNYINETYAMASFPLSYNFANRLNKTKLTEKP
jgi:hypothetical protein